MASRVNLDADGLPPDDVPYSQASAAQMQTYAAAADDLARFEVPVLVHAANSHEYLFVASFDGTSSDKSGDPKGWTNVAKIDEQAEKAIGLGERQLGRGYVPGPGTEQNWFVGFYDKLQGYTDTARAETMYKQFVEQAAKWRASDPDAQIRIASVGFSRGTGAEVLFHRMVDERGILDPSTATYRVDRDGLVQKATYNGAPLVPPGRIAQVAVMLDPVNTGIPLEHDRRLPPSVISAVQITAMNERRKGYESDRILDPGLTADGRFLSAPVAGAHSDIGGDGNNRNGLAIRNLNFAVDVVNSLRDRPFLQRDVEPDDPRLNVVHRSEQGMLLYQVLPKVNRANPNGQNELLVSRQDMGKVADPYNAEPRDEALNAQFEHQRVRTGSQSLTAASVERMAATELFCRLARMEAAGDAMDWKMFLAENQALASGAAGQALWNRAEAGAASEDLVREPSQQQSAPVARVAPVVAH